MLRHVLVLLVSMFTVTANAADLSKLNRVLKKEPAYRNQPGYLLLAFGLQAKDHVWLVRDGKTLYVDRNGDGDLTAANEKIAAKKIKKYDSEKFGYRYELGDLSVGGKVHKNLQVNLPRLKLYGDEPSFKSFRPLHAALKEDPMALGVAVWVDVESPRHKGNGIGGRLSMSAGFYDARGLLQFGKSPADAPVIHFDGPLTITYYGWVPSLNLIRSNEMVLMVGTPGMGPGTFAMLGYQDAIPEKVFPKVDIVWPAREKNAGAIKETLFLKQRC